MATNFIPLIISGFVTVAIVVLESLRTKQNRVKRRTKRAVFKTVNAASVFAGKTGIGKDFMNKAKTYAEPTRMEKVQNIYSDQIRKYLNSKPSEIAKLTPNDVKNLIRTVVGNKKRTKTKTKRTRRNRTKRNRTKRNRTKRNRTKRNRTRKSKR
jgi:isopropylmalate/homocitrate/citramalate synthase